MTPTPSPVHSYTTYLVTCALATEGVRRRYSDFEWIRDLLVARYHGIAVPLSEPAHRSPSLQR